MSTYVALEASISGLQWSDHEHNDLRPRARVRSIGIVLTGPVCSKSAPHSSSPGDRHTVQRLKTESTHRSPFVLVAVLVNIYYPDVDRVTVEQGGITVTLIDGEAKVYVPEEAYRAAVERRRQ